MRRVNVSGPVQSSASMVASAALGYSSNGPTRTRKVPSSSIDKFTTDPGRMPFDSAQAFGRKTPRLEYPSFCPFCLSSSLEAVCVDCGKLVLRMDDTYGREYSSHSALYSPHCTWLRAIVTELVQY